MHKPLEAAWVGPKIRWGASQIITRAGSIVLGWWRLRCGVCLNLQSGSRAGLSKGTMTSASTFVWEIGARSDLALKPDNSVPLHMSLALVQHWSSE